MNKGRTALFRRISPGTIFSLLLFLMLVGFLLMGTRSISAGSYTRARSTLENSLSRCITSCYALEGRYPASLDYMKEQYGLSYDEDRFFVDYQVRGSNIRPDVTVIDLAGGEQR